MSDTDSTDDGWCGGFEVHMTEGRPTPVLGPDGEPVRYLKRHRAGFDLRPSTKSRKIIKEAAQRHSAALTRLADK